MCVGHCRRRHLWQGRFCSSSLDPTHLWPALADIERNPVCTRLVRKAWRWPWSSAAIHVGQTANADELLDLDSWRKAWTPARWRKQLAEPADDAWRPRYWRAPKPARRRRRGV